MINYDITKGESLPFIRVVLDEQLTIATDDWACSATIFNTDNTVYLTKQADVKDNAFWVQFTKEDLARLEAGIYTIVIETLNVDGFRDIVARKLRISSPKQILPEIEQVSNEVNLLDRIQNSQRITKC